MSPSRTQEPGSVAVIGMSGRFPGAPDLSSFWHNLRDGAEAARELSQGELEAAGVEADLLRDPRYVRTGVVLEDIDRFDASFFGLTPREAELMDPQHRLFLECAWEALEDAGYDPGRAPGEVGVFTSALMSHYLLLHLLPRRELMRQAGALAVRIFNDKDFLPTRVSYELNLRGPSLAIQTACSSSLVGCHVACQSLLNFECDMALTGGVALNLPQAGYLYQEGSIYSPDGHCRPFDARAQGTIIGSGVGVVVLRRLEDALAAGDRIRAVIRGSAVNNDGSIKVGFTAPSVEGQAAVVAAALEFADVSPDTVGLIEAHGTGTPMGDPIEVAALTQVFREATSRRGFCALGSVKASIGHLDTAAGVAGLIKAALALENKVIPPSINCDQPNPDLDLPGTPFYVAAEAQPWTANGVPRRAGVTSLGVGGTNAHVVLEEAPPRQASGESRPWQLLVWSAREDQALEDATRRLADHLENGPAAPLADLAYTLQMGRAAFDRRRALVCRDAEEALESLRGGSRRWLDGGDASGEPKVAFLFPGQGSQHPGMGRDLYRGEPVYREVIDDCAERLRPLLGLDLRPLLHAGEGDEEAAARQLQQTRIAQPALFVVEYALARLWMDWGVTPHALLGHSVGEYVAACLAGVLSLADALALVAARGRLMQSLPPGAMLSVALAAGELEPLLDAQLSLAAINAEAVTTVAGPAVAVEALAARLAERKVEHRRLRTSHAFHSAMVEPVVGAFVEQAARVELRPPQIRLLSNVSGTWMTSQQATDPRYWGQQLRRTVRFSAALRELLSAPEGALLEVGPGQTLTRLARLHRQGGQAPWAVASMRHPQQAGEDLEHLLGALGRLWTGGVRIDWERFARFERRQRVAAPTYPFQRRRYWIEPIPLWGDGEEAHRTPDEEPAQAEASPAEEAPATPLERAVARVWREVLGVERIAAGDDFFELGGNSLSASQVVSRLWETQGIQASVQDLFEAPTLAGLAARLAAAGAEPVSLPPPLRPVSRDEPLPLSFAQQRLWFMDQLEPGSPLYNMPVALRAEGPLDASVLALALGEIVRRHEALRTVFAVQESTPVQVIRPAAPFRLPVVDLSGLPEERREPQARSLAGEEAGQPFDLARGPLLRGVLLRLAEQDHVLALTLHHIVGDGWSLGLLVRELAALQAAFAAGRPSPLPELAVQYADFALWQRRWLQGEALAAQLGWWRGRLAGAPTVLALPTDRPRPAVQRFRGQSQLEQLPLHGAAALARQTAATPFMILLAAFTALLARSSGQLDLVVGSPIAGRTRTETEPLIGLFLNTLALRADLSGDPSVRELVRRMREVTLGAYAHQDLPFEKLVEDLSPERDLSHSPIFQVLFVLQNAPFQPIELPGLRLSPVAADTATAKLDLVLNAVEADGGLYCRWMYNSDLFDFTRIARLRGHFAALLGAALADPDRRLSALPLLDAAERHQLLCEWNDSQVARPAAARLHELFAAQAERTPEAVAAVCEGESLTYRELLDRSRSLARHLRSLGVQGDGTVGALLERSLEMIVGLLGTLLADAAYVPLDPTLPPERIGRLVESAGLGVVLTQERHARLLPGRGERAVLLDRSNAFHQLAMGPRRGEGGGPGEAGLAYVIYTSGSTGTPKGVMIPHRGIVNRLLWMQEAYGLTPMDRVLQKTPFSFDVSLWELFWPLLAGARLVFARPEGHKDPLYLTELISREGITTLHFVPSMLQAFLEAPGLEALTSVRKVMASGEALPPELVRRFFQRMPHAELHNLYGPTEASVDVSFWACEPEPPRDAVPIGRPIANHRLHVVDRHLEPQPIGVHGELLLGGPGLARGYLGRADLTAAAFVPDPFCAEPGGRLYRTGDLVSQLPDGNVVYLGRIDRQVKVRGFRIELGEIEAVLAMHPAVQQAAVDVRGAGTARRLVAWVAARTAEPEIAATLRDHLQARLPDAMIPSAFVLVAALPLTPNGKVDRRALPDPEPAPAAAPQASAPRTPLEEHLAGLWREALAVESVGIHDSFFDLGGNSITGAILINRLQREIGGIIHVVTLFDAPTVAKMADYLACEQREAVLRLWGAASLGAEAARAPQAPAGPVDAARMAAFRALIPPLPPDPDPGAAKNPSAIFLLSPPRAGSTLLRVMLGGHPRLFAPPELELLSFNTMAGREATFPGRDSFWLEGLIRTVMELRRCDVEEARRILGAAVAEGWTTQRFYRQLQEWLGGRTLVDKTPSYALDPAILRRAEEAFEQPFYIHLVRHPQAAIRSFEEAKLDELFFRHTHPFHRAELAELIWLASHQNIAEHLSRVPAERQLRVRFEDLVRHPEAELRRICAALGIDFHPAMTDPYQDGRARMTDGIHSEGRMLGDVKFLQYKGVEAGVAERWREAQDGSLGEPTWEMAVRFGYERPAPPPPAILPRAGGRGEPLPLSFAQQRLWFIDQLEPGRPLYNLPVVLRIEGPLRAEVLDRCLGEIVRRHEAVRTVFVTVEGSPVQVVRPAETFRLPVVDLSGLPESRRERLARTLAGEEAARPFDLARGPLLRGLLLLAESHHVVALTLHHIVSDGWSIGILVREVAALYPAFSQGRPSPLPELPVQYADFAAWQSSWLQGEVLEREIAFWRRQLAGLPPLLELPTDRPRPAVQSYRGATRPVRLPAELLRQAEALGRREGATLFMLLLAGFQALLSRYSGQQDLAVGSPVAGRNRAEIEGLIGFFVNSLVLRGDLTGEPAFRELLGRTRKTALDAYRHQEVPFEKLVEELAPERTLAHTPLFQVMLALQDAPGETPEIRGLRLRPVGVEGTTARLDLTLNLAKDGDGLAGVIEYASDLFDAATVDRLSGHFERLLAGLLAGPGRRIGELPLLSPGEGHQVLAEWNDTAAGREESTLLHEPFEAWAGRTPGAVAAIWRGEEITYGEIEERANRLAHHLARLGARPGSLVGIHLRRGPGMIVALLAALKTGAAYVPLELRHPPARLRFILETLEIPCLITESEQLGAVREIQEGASRPAVVVCLDRVDLEGHPPSAPPRRASPDGLAYIIFTSGSTGTPKGVMVRHRPVVNLLRWAHRAFAFSPADRVLFVTALSFDLSVFDIFGLLGAGGSVRIADEEEIREPERLVRVLAEEPVTFWDSAPAALEQTVPFLAPVLEGSGPRARPALRLVFLSGDWIPVSLPGRIRERFPEARVVALGGATEATVWSNVFPVGRVEPSWTSIPYGRPIDNARYHVLDPQLAPCPVGVPGDLYIGGGCLADGYAREPELTAHKFVPDPWSGSPGARLYRTGDRARYRPDGNLEFLGRLDHQVKIRGFRIELGEIESVLAQHPAVREAVATVRADPGTERRLVAYLVPRTLDETPAADGLQAWLQQRLPEYMIPAVFVILPELPLTPNGKLDRQALPAPSRDVARAEYVAPRNALEEVLAGMWAEVLNLERVGVHDDFFAIGGQSLLAAQLIAQVREIFPGELHLRTLFGAPTVAGLAAALLHDPARRAQVERTAELMLELADAPEEGEEVLEA